MTNYKQSEKKKPRLQIVVNATQDGIVRYDPKLENKRKIEGLGTYNLFTCLAIILVGENGCISLIHKSSQLGLQCIDQEIRWINEKCSHCFLVYRNIQPNSKYLQETQKNIVDPHLEKTYNYLKKEKRLNVKKKNIESDSIRIDFKGKIFEVKGKDYDKSIDLVEPFFQRNKYVNLLNRFLNDPEYSKKLMPFIQFDTAVPTLP
ncbi:hypothetical protein M0813_24989 [Anaeramoeba flamelloides]|uniref:LAGLIDADG homing endonuclease n=1 Tax=Anaeramoeba flamelloides TaxID=1746091 RepID=A0ABQ8Y4T8_9EUKA|nr:hypothetical protein M0813_24989 [Anaeramoeba flamelloides]